MSGRSREEKKEKKKIAAVYENPSAFLTLLYWLFLFQPPRPTAQAKPLSQCLTSLLARQATSRAFSQRSTAAENFGTASFVRGKADIGCSSASPTRLPESRSRNLFFFPFFFLFQSAGPTGGVPPLHSSDYQTDLDELSNNEEVHHESRARVLMASRSSPVYTGWGQPNLAAYRLSPRTRLSTLQPRSQSKARGQVFQGEHLCQDIRQGPHLRLVDTYTRTCARKPNTCLKFQRQRKSSYSCMSIHVGRNRTENAYHTIC